MLEVCRVLSYVVCLSVSFSVIFCDMLAELEELDKSRAWPRLFQRLNWEASQKAGAVTAAKLPENRQLNRYRDVLPYDHSRIILKEQSPDYINANLVEVPRLNQSYILTQGPLPHTVEHFWQMIWEQKSAAVVMLNKVVEKNQKKCFQYWPCGEVYGHVDQMEFGNFRIYYIQEKGDEFFTIRTLELESVLSGEKRVIYHFHYFTWPDFGVPTSPATFLAFLFEVRKAGVLSSDVGPCVIHCSAGIGRSGTFVMVDSILKEIEYAEDMDQISITDVLLEVRQYRAGLIQTPDQLRFTYLAILEGARVLMPEIFKRAVNRHLQSSAAGENESHEETVEQNSRASINQEDSGEETPPPLPPRRRLEAAAADEPETKRSRPVEHEPEPEKEVFSDSSDGSDEIIDLSSISDSEPEEESVKVNEEDVDSKLEEPAAHEPSSKELEKENEGEKSLQQTDQTEKDKQQDDEGLQQTEQAFQETETNEVLQHSDEGETKEKDSATELRRRKREERKQKITGLVENIKKNVKREEDAKVWKSRLKRTLIAVVVCSVVYVTFKYLTS
ncbi:tyrosine-protein phosphatase non-receptor type 1-like isoform X1 [Porites lutea]|uniref:tyrosine-protein phosphatase non-receptor type 1-like isoform X1 n=1 Tax=Porites lutea TaxID=51062 RepID=UPI003CC5A726